MGRAASGRAALGRAALGRALLVGIGGAAGTLVRATLATFGTSGTFAANVVGSFALGFLVARRQDAVVPLWAIPLVAIGFLGGLTTFSTFVVEALDLVLGGRWTVGAAYVAVSTVVGLVAALAGLVVGGVRRGMRAEGLR